MFNVHFAEPHTGVANLPEDTPDAFAKFAGWIYSKTIELDEIEDEYIEKHINLFVFVGKYVVTNLMVDIMDAMTTHSFNHFLLVKMKDIEYGYKHTRADCVLRL